MAWYPGRVDARVREIVLIRGLLLGLSLVFALYLLLHLCYCPVAPPVQLLVLFDLLPQLLLPDYPSYQLLMV